MKIAFVTFGCRLNRAEALAAEARFAAAGHDAVSLAAGTVPDWIVVRGCSVTARAQRDCEKELARLRARFPSARIFATGCLPGAIPMPDPGSAPGGKAAWATRDVSRAYLKIQDGCGAGCAFCIVPRFRGPPVSVPFGEIVAQAREVRAAGFREWVVTGCNLALYRDAGRGLAEVLSALAEISGDGPHRVRLGSLEPGICDGAVLAALERHPNICRFLHLSLQSASDAVLARMNRPYRIAAAAAFCDAVRRRFGTDFMLGADVIAGFPGETAADHAATRDFLARYGFANLHVFPYSERPGTPAAGMDGALPRAVRLARARELERDGAARRAAFARQFVGRTVEACVERGGCGGWTDAYLRCTWENPLPRRRLATLRVTGVSAQGRLTGVAEES